MSDPAPAPQSKTRIKKEMHELQRLGEALAAMPEHRLDVLPLAEPLRDAVREFKRTRSHEGRRRQMQYIGKLMRQEDAEPIREAVAAERLGSARDTLALHAAERWRDELLAIDAALERWVAEHPASDAKQLRRLIDAARTETAPTSARGAPPRKGDAYRELFRFIRNHHGN